MVIILAEMAAVFWCLSFAFFCCRCFPFVVINVSLALFNLNINHGERGLGPVPRWGNRIQMQCATLGGPTTTTTWWKTCRKFWAKKKKKRRIIWRSHGACCLHGSTTISALYMLLVPYRIYDVLGSQREWVYRSRKFEQHLLSFCLLSLLFSGD